MVNFLKKDKWPPYLVGLLIGILLTLIFAYGYQIGVSSGISRVAALIDDGLHQHDQTKGTYFGRLLSEGAIFDWKVLFIAGILIGSFLASKLTTEPIPQKNCLWIANYGTAKIKRFFAAFMGGTLLMLGARIADGCTSGHVISGGAQMSIASWVFMFSVFSTAIPAAFFLYKKSWRQ